jgi:DNA modification methylase
MRKETIGRCELYLGDCLEILPEIGKVDAVVTDPPYDVMLGSIKNGQATRKGQIRYEDFEDTPEYIKDVVVPAIKLALSKSDRGFITHGNRNMFLYPQPVDMGVWYNPAACTMGRWGHSLASPIFWYGKNPKNVAASGASSITGHISDVSDIKNKLHPCPKPLKFMRWAVNKVSLENEIICDSFMGSGTTGVACVELGRKFISIEINEKYFDVACKRIEIANSQGDLFREAI